MSQDIRGKASKGDREGHSTGLQYQIRSEEQLLLLFVFELFFLHCEILYQDEEYSYPPLRRILLLANLSDCVHGKSCKTR